MITNLQDFDTEKPQKVSWKKICPIVFVMLLALIVPSLLLNRLAVYSWVAFFGPERTRLYAIGRLRHLGQDSVTALTAIKENDRSEAAREAADEALDDLISDELMKETGFTDYVVAYKIRYSVPVPMPPPGIDSGSASKLENEAWNSSASCNRDSREAGGLSSHSPVRSRVTPTTTDISTSPNTAVDMSRQCANSESITTGPIPSTPATDATPTD